MVSIHAVSPLFGTSTGAAAAGAAAAAAGAAAAGVAAALALNAGVTVRNVDVAAVQRTLRAQGADPGDQTGPNADVPKFARAFAEAA